MGSLKLTIYSCRAVKLWLVVVLGQWEVIWVGGDRGVPWNGMARMSDGGE